MKVKLTAFGIAKDILQSRSTTFEFAGADIASLKAALITDFPDFSKLRNLSFAVDEEYREDDYALSEATEVVIIPPVSGG